MTFLDGCEVRSAEDWNERRREILGIFAREMEISQGLAPISG